MTRTKWIIFAIICLTVLGGMLFFTRQNNENITGDPFTIEKTGVNADHVFGSTTEEVVLIEYGDFQCPGCGGMYDKVKELKERYKDDLTFVFRNFPLTNIHPNALAAATVAEAAAKQGKFWEMHNALFESQEAWSNVSIERRNELFGQYAQQVGLNLDQYNKDIKGEDVTKKINHDRATGKKVGVDSTPSFYLAGKKLDQATWKDPATFEKVIQEAITKATGKTFTDVEPDKAHE